MQPRRRPLQHPVLTCLLGAGILLVPALAHAGEIKFGEGVASLATDDNGKLTADGKASAISKLDSVPGEDGWDMNLWARLDSGAAEGPLYIEFWQRIDTDLDGKPDQDSLAYRHEDSNFDGSRYYLTNIYLEENFGFNKDRTYKVKIVQVSSSGRDLKLAEGKLTLIDTDRAPEGAEGGDAGEGEEDVSEQDAIDSFAGGDEDESDAPAAAPPPVEETPAKKRGCSVGDPTEHPLSLGLVVLLAGAGLTRRPRRS